MRRAAFKSLTLAVALVLMGLVPLSASAQTSDHGPDYRTYDTSGTPRPDREKSDEQLRHEEQLFRQYQAACEGGDPAACSRLGTAYELGIGTAQVRPIAAILYAESCDAGDANGCYRLGRLNSIAIDDAGEGEAVGNYTRACELGSVEACMDLAEVYDRGIGTQRDRGRAEALLRSACGTGSPNACRQLARFLLADRDSQAHQIEARDRFYSLCKEGEREACLELRSLHVIGDFAEPLPPEAEVLFLACSADDADSCARLGDRAMLGEGVVQDRDYALEVYDRACALDDSYCSMATDMRAAPDLDAACGSGDAGACAQFGRILADRNMIYYNPLAAAEALAFACRNGIRGACSDAGHAALTASEGPGTSMSVDAREFLETGCGDGDSGACATLASSLYYGGKLGEDRGRAFELYAVLCERGFVSDCKTLEKAVLEDPGVPLPVAGANFLPPDDPVTGESPLADRLRELREEAGERCTSSELEFRGRTYRDTVCDPQVRVINGRELRGGEAPWQALIWRPINMRGIARDLSAQERVACGGSVIADGWVLTAAHCLTDQGRSIVGRGYSIRLGVHNPRLNEGVTYPIIAGYVHKDYDRSDLSFDIALIRYDRRRGVPGETTQSIGTIRPDTRAVDDRRITSGMPVYTYGWGWTRAQRGTSTDGLRSVRLELTSPERCTEISGYDGAKLNSALCAGGRNFESSCKGDSGGPLIYYGDRDGNPRIIGVVSSGEACGSTGVPDLYTRVGPVYSWIRETMARHR